MDNTNALFAERFDAARAAWADGNEPAAAECLRLAILAADGDPGLRQELATALLNLGRLSRKFGPSGEAEAGRVLAEALAIREELFGSTHAALAPVLHELSRLHLQQSQHARSQEALERLLDIARLKGADHPDVATALCDLAFVKRKLGDDASAEALLRDALRIRENVLEPNDMLTVGTLERLSEVCVARGKFAEALPLLQRVLPAREAALGADHERVRAARSRIADLESQLPVAAITAPIPSSTPSSIAMTFADVSLDDWRSTVEPALDDSAEPARSKRSVYASAGMAAVVIAIVGLLMVRPRAASGRDPGATETNVAQRTANAGSPIAATPATRIASIGAGAAVTSAATHADSLRVASAPPTSPAAVVQQTQRAPKDARPELGAPRIEVHLDSASIPSMPAIPTGDAILRSAMERRRTADTVRPDTRDEAARPATADADDAHTSPKMIGRAPDLAFPSALLRSGLREGQVVVDFMVNELGRVDVASTIVERSDHELFTAAVREALPRMRFEPAHTLGRESKPVAAWVSVPFRFTTKK